MDVFFQTHDSAMPLSTASRTIPSKTFICLLFLAGGLVAEWGHRPVLAQESVPGQGDTLTPTKVSLNRGDERKSPGLALLYSLGGTVGGTLVLLPAGGAGVLLGPVFGPAFGHYYANHSKKANRGIYVRTGIVGTATLLAVGTFNPAPLGVGLLGLAVHAVYDIVMAPFSAQEYNKGLASNVHMSPTTHPQGTQVGMSVQVHL